MPPAELTDRDLIGRVLAGNDRTAFAMLVERHQSMIRSMLRRLTGDPAKADDLAQETFILAWKHLASFRSDARFSTWLYRIAHNCFLAEVRKRHDAPAPPSDGDGAEAVDAGRDHSEATVLRMDVDRALQSLSDAERAAIVQCYHNDLTHEEAALVLGCPLGTVKTHVLRARQKLRAALAAWGSKDGHHDPTQ